MPLAGELVSAPLGEEDFAGNVEVVGGQHLAEACFATVVDLQALGILPVANVVEGVAQQVVDVQLGQTKGIVEPAAEFEFAQQVVVPVVQHVFD